MMSHVLQFLIKIGCCLSFAEPCNSATRLVAVVQHFFYLRFARFYRCNTHTRITCRLYAVTQAEVLRAADLLWSWIFFGFYNRTCTLLTIHH